MVIIDRYGNGDGAVDDKRLLNSKMQNGCLCARVNTNVIKPALSLQSFEVRLSTYTSPSWLLLQAEASTRPCYGILANGADVHSGTLPIS